MVTLNELDLKITLANAIDGENFYSHELKQGNSLQPVDMIFEPENSYLFVEIKDPDIPGASNAEGFRQKLQSGKVIRKVAGKFRDTTFFRFHQNKGILHLPPKVLYSLLGKSPCKWGLL